MRVLCGNMEYNFRRSIYDNKKITLDVWEKNNVFIAANQGEVASRFLEITIKDNNNKFDLTDKSVQICLVKPDKTQVFNSATIKDAKNGICEVEPTSQI